MEKIAKDTYSQNYIPKYYIDFNVSKLPSATSCNASAGILNKIVANSFKSCESASLIYEDSSLVEKQMIQITDEDAKLISKHDNNTMESNVLLDCEEALDFEDELVCDDRSTSNSEKGFQLPSILRATKKSKKERDLSKYNINPQSLQSKHPDLSQNMILLLLNWLNEVSAEFGLRRSTFYLAYHYLVLYIDKALGINRKDLQLIGTTALYLACKVEEVVTPVVALFEMVTNYGYSQRQILDMEKSIVSLLEWNLNPPTLEYWMHE